MGSEMGIRDRYRRWCGKGKPDVLQLLVPATLRQDYMQRAHSGKCGGHLRTVRRTLDQIQRRAFWFGWRRDVRRLCQQCTNCNGYYRGQLPRSGPLQPMLSGAPLERLHIDLTGLHPRSRRGATFAGSASSVRTVMAISADSCRDLDRGSPCYLEHRSNVSTST